MKMFRKVIRVLLKILAVPVMCAAFLVYLAGRLLAGWTAWIFRILAFLCVIAAVLCGLMGLEDAVEIKRMLIGALVIFLIPCVGEGIAGVFGFVGKSLMGFIAS